MPLEPGDEAPDFTLIDQHGEPFSLHRSLRERKARHLVFFYPKADTPGCTAQSCGLRDVAGEVGDTVIVGISPDKPARQAKFDEKHGLGFPLLADEDHAVAEAYEVWAEKSMYGRKYRASCARRSSWTWTARSSRRGTRSPPRTRPPTWWRPSPPADPGPAAGPRRSVSQTDGPRTTGPVTRTEAFGRPDRSPGPAALHSPTGHPDRRRPISQPSR